MIKPRGLDPKSQSKKCIGSKFDQLGFPYFAPIGLSTY
uniref:Uncharacterized protein n=1 Tax=Arundo donax TaxID=35708 RepID=A0A0A9A120_ARUDO